MTDTDDSSDSSDITAVVTQIGDPLDGGTLLPNWLFYDTVRELGSDGVLAICTQLSREKLGDDEALVEQRARELVAKHRRPRSVVIEEYDQVLDQLRYVAAEVIGTLQWRVPRMQSAVDRGDCDPALIEVVIGELAEIRDQLRQAVQACTDKPDTYSDGTDVVVFGGFDDWDLVVTVAKPPTT